MFVYNLVSSLTNHKYSQKKKNITFGSVCWSHEFVRSGRKAFAYGYVQDDVRRLRQANFNKKFPGIRNFLTVSTVRTYMTADVGNLEDLGSRACVLAAFGRHREAIEVINTALWRYPDDRRLYNNRCCSYIQTFDIENALADAEYLIENYPDFVKGYVRKGEVLTIMRKYSEAEKEYRVALDLAEDETLHVKCLQLQLLQIVSCGFDPYSAWKALCETGSVQQSLRLLKTPYRNYEHVVNANFYGDTYFKQIEEGSTFSEEDEEEEDYEEDEGLYDLGSIESLSHLMKKLEVKMKESAAGGKAADDKTLKERRQKENVFGGKKLRRKFPNKQDKAKKIIRRNKKKMLFVKCDEKPENILTVRNK